MGVQADHVARPSPLPLSLAPLARPQEKDSFGFSPEGKKKYAETYAGNAPQDPEQDGTDDEEEENTVRSVPLLVELFSLSTTRTLTHIRPPPLALTLAADQEGQGQEGSGSRGRGRVSAVAAREEREEEDRAACLLYSLLLLESVVLWYSSLRSREKRERPSSAERELDSARASPHSVNLAESFTSRIAVAVYPCPRPRSTGPLACSAPRRCASTSRRGGRARRPRRCGGRP